MIKGIEDFGTEIQKAILEFISTNMDMSKDIEVTAIDDYVVSINDRKYFIVTDAEEKGILARYNKEKFDDFFDGFTIQQMDYVDEDLWYEDNGLHDFKDWIEDETEWAVDDKDYYDKCNFYEVH